MAALDTIIARVMVIVRGIALAEIVVQVVIWRSFYLASPWLLWAPAAALAWGGTAMAYLRRRRPGWRLVCADTAVYAGLAFGAAWCVPTAIRGEAGSWLFIVVVTQSVTPVWFAPRALATPLAVTPGIALAAGTALAPAAGLVTAAPRRASLVLLFVVVAMHMLIRRMLCARAVLADTALAAADREARDQYVILSENIERREQDRLLHDTILNTLTAISRSGGTAAAISQCRQDIGLLQSALSDSDTTHGRGRADSGPRAAIEAVAGEMRARGLAVDLEITGCAAAEGTPESRLVPGPIVAAIAHATREALANVAEHAGTGQAWVTLMAVRRATLASRSAAERAAVAAIGEVRRDRLGLLEMEALPLLRGIADGILDPSDTAVRRRCAEHAATLRHALVDRTSQPSGLLAGLGPVLGAARERNVPVEVQVIGDPGDPGEDVVRATVAAVDSVLRALPPQPVILTVLASADEAEMYLTFERPPAAGCDVAGPGGAVPAGAAWRAALEAGDEGPGCLEVRWRTVVPA